MRGDRELYRDKIEVSLDGKQVFYLFFGAAVVACLVFVLGVMVGRRLESRAHADAVQAMEASSSDPLAALDLLAAGAGADDLSFPKELGRDRPDTAPAIANAEADKAVAEKAAADKAVADKTAADKAAADKAAAEAAKTAAEARAKAAAERAKAAAAAKVKKEAAAKAARGSWTLQLSSFQDETEAKAFFNKLRGSGHSPFISRAEVPGKGTWFRVRLGRYTDYDAAVAAKRVFEKRQQIIAYVTRL